MEFLGQETSRSGINTYLIHGQKLMLDQYEIVRTILDTVCNEAESRAGDRYRYVSFVSFFKIFFSITLNIFSFTVPYGFLIGGRGW